MCMITIMVVCEEGTLLLPEDRFTHCEQQRWMRGGEHERATMIQQ